MWTLFRITALAVILAVVVPAVAPNTAIGQFFSAIVDDAMGFCARQPIACSAANRAVSAGRTFVAQQLNGVDEEPNTLTGADRTLQPAGGSSHIPAPNVGIAHIN